MKKIMMLLLLAAVCSQPAIPRDHQAKPVVQSTTFFFAYDLAFDIVYPYTVPPGVLPYVPPGPEERPYYAEYTSYYLNLLTNPYRYEPAGFKIAEYWGPW